MALRELGAVYGVFVCVAASLIMAACNQAQHVSTSKIKVEGSWTEVREGWPLESQEYFVATEKGHHIIELRDIPTNLDGDLEVRLEYYYNYTRARPHLHMIPCRTNILLLDEHSEESSNKWLKHDIVVQREDCIERNELAYNVLLHDAGDVFAWRVLTVSTVTHPEPSKPVDNSDEGDKLREQPEDIGLKPNTPKAPNSNQEEVPNFFDDLVHNDAKDNIKTPEPNEPKDTNSNPETPDQGDSQRKRAAEREQRRKDDAEHKKGEANKELLPEQVDEQQLPEAGKESHPEGEQKKLVPEEADNEAQRKEDSKEAESKENDVQQLPKGDDDKESQPERGEEKPVTQGTGNEPDRNGDGEETAAKEDIDAQVPIKEDGKEQQPGADDKKPVPQDGNDEPVRREEDEKVVQKEDNEEPAPKRPDDEPQGQRIDEKSQSAADEKRPAPNDDKTEPLDFGILQRFKRMAKTKKDEPRKFDEVCRPSKCDRSKFGMAHFSPLISGVPKLPEGISLADKRNKLFLNLNDKPLTMEIQSSKSSLSEVNSCLKFQLFMEKDSELEVLLEEPKSAISPKRKRTLELIRRKETHSTSGDWEQFQRCISDYMPRFDIPQGGDNSIRFQFKPKPDKAKRNTPMAIQFSEVPGKASYVSVLFPIQSHLPDIRLISNLSTLNKFWLMDRDGRAKPRVELRGEPNKPDRTLEISDIDSTQDFFDITSRWMAVKDVDFLEQPVLLVYRARKADWIKQIDLQFQRAGDNYDEWISQVAYKAALQYQRQDESNQTVAASSSNSPVATAKQADAEKGPEPQQRLIDLPIRLKGLDSSEFRVRLRHHLAPPKRAGSTSVVSAMNSALSLEVKSLALADACTYRSSYCFNGGMCKPTGPAQAECLCPQGFTGLFCEHKNPCDVLHGERAGSEICRSLGARCVQGLPVMRCEWPNDQFYKCQKLYKLDANGQFNSSSIVGNHEIGESSDTKVDGKPASGESGSLFGKLVDGRDFEALPKEEQVEALKGVVNQQAKLVIILAVFMIAILVFAVVLVGSMVARLRKSSRRLRESQSGIQQMVPRVPEAPVSSALGSSSFGRARAGYTNSSFDVE